MNDVTYEQSLEVLLLQAGANGRAEALLGGCAGRALEAAAPFLIGDAFPEVYLEFPLAGEPFLDVTVVYGELQQGVRVDSPLAAGMEAALSAYAQMRSADEMVSCGFELDCGAEVVPTAGVHFQPRHRRDFVRPFCEALGESERAELYLAQDARMPQGWDLSFLGLFRGRPDAPLRVCGYLDADEAAACAADSARLRAALEQAGLSAFDDAMLAQASCVLGLAPQEVDFQLDVRPDGTVGDMLAFDIYFDGADAAAARGSFESGAGARVVEQLGEWGIADERAGGIAEMTLTRGIPVARGDGSWGVHGFALVPRWLKVRWRDGVLQPAKVYMQASAGPANDLRASRGRQA